MFRTESLQIANRQISTSSDLEYVQQSGLQKINKHTPTRKKKKLGEKKQSDFHKNFDDHWRFRMFLIFEIRKQDVVSVFMKVKLYIAHLLMWMKGGALLLFS